MQHYAVKHYITGSRLMLEYNEQVSRCYRHISFDFLYSLWDAPCFSRPICFC